MTQFFGKSRFGQAQRQWRMSGRQRRLTWQALSAAYDAFARNNPRWTQSLFDRHLLESKIIPLLAETLRDGPPLTAHAMATAWASQLTQDVGKQRRLAVGATRVSEEFLALLKTYSEALSEPSERLASRRPSAAT